MTLQNASYLCQPHFITKLHESACVYFYTLSDFVLFICDFLVIMIVMAFHNHIYNLNILKNLFRFCHTTEKIYICCYRKYQVPVLSLSVWQRAMPLQTPLLWRCPSLRRRRRRAVLQWVSRISYLRRRHGFCLISKLLLNSLRC